MTNPTDEHREQARKIRLPFPCGCLDAHQGGGVVVEEYTCETHHAITTYANQRAEQSWREGIEAAARLAETMAIGETYETGRQKAVNIASAIRSLNQPR